MCSASPADREHGTAGYSYAGLLVRADRADLLRYLAEAGFTGWIGPQEGEWVVAVPARLRGAVTARGADLESLGADAARRFDCLTLTAAVHADRVLRLAMWSGFDELGRYLSDPADGRPDDDDVFPEPQGVEYAEAFAIACGRPDQADDLADVLGEILDEENQNESERLLGAVELLGLPRWLIATNSLPKDLPGGLPAADFTRLFRGRTGTSGRVLAWLAGLVRWRREPVI
jgi:hypothetical protein